MNDTATVADVYQAALTYHELGLCVIPIAPREKRPLVEWKQYQDKRPTVKEIHTWFTRYPNANIGVVCGPASGWLFVLDFDSEAPYKQFEQKFPAIVKNTIVVKTARGYHVWLRSQELVQGTKIITPAGNIDVKGAGGYVLAPPSLHPSGTRYTFMNNPGHIKAVKDLTALGFPCAQARAGEKGNGKGSARGIGDIITEGERNNTLTSLAGTMRRRGMSVEAIKSALLRENELRCCPPLPNKEVEQIAESVGRYPPGEVGEDKDNHKEDHEKNPTGRHSYRDFAHFSTLCPLWRNRYRWATHLRSWLRWNGKYWEQITEERALREAMETLRKYYIIKLIKTRNQNRVRHLTRRLIEACGCDIVLRALKILRGEGGFETKSEEWDRDPWLLNVENGEIDLRDGSLKPHRPESLCTKLAPVRCDPAARGQTWEAHLARFLPNPNIRRQVQRDLGVSLVGANLDEMLPIWFGSGANGKSTTARVIQNVLGDYATQAAPGLLIRKRFEEHTTELADLKNRRVVFSVEIDKGSALNEVRAKKLSGGDRVKARYLYQNYFEFSPTWVIFLLCNHQPVISGTDWGIWRRVRLIPWNVCIPTEERLPQEEIVQRLTQEGSAILNWLLDGLRDWQQNPRWVAPEVIGATETYRKDQDRISNFLSDCCVLRPNTHIDVGELYNAYSQWCDEVGEDPLSKKAFSEHLKRLGAAQRRVCHGRVRQWVGIRLRTDADGEATPELGGVTEGDRFSGKSL